MSLLNDFTKINVDCITDIGTACSLLRTSLKINVIAIESLEKRLDVDKQDSKIGVSRSLLLLSKMEEKIRESTVKIPLKQD